MCLASLCPQVNKLYCTRSQTRFHSHGLCKMLQIKCREYQPSELSCVLHPWDLQYRWCVHWLPDQSVTQTDWRPIWNAGCLTCEYGNVWLALQFMVERWVPWSGKYGISLRSPSLDTIRQVRHSLVNYIGLDIEDNTVWVHSLQWYCIPRS